MRRRHGRFRRDPADPRQGRPESEPLAGNGRFLRRHAPRATLASATRSTIPSGAPPPARSTTGSTMRPATTGILASSGRPTAAMKPSPKSANWPAISGMIVWEAEFHWSFARPYTAKWRIEASISAGFPIQTSATGRLRLAPHCGRLQMSRRRSAFRPNQR